MEENKIRRNLYRALRKTGVPAKKINLSASFSDDLKFDTTDWEIFIYYLIGYFKISVKDEETIRFNDVNETLKYLRVLA